jgi:transposase-like protein
VNLVSIVDNGELVRCTADEARVLTDRIKVGVDAVWHLIAEAYQRRAWAALGYSSWDDYTTREFGTSRLRLPREERQEVVASLRESGLSIRAITAATGVAPNTVQSDLRQVSQIDTPDPVEDDEFTPVTGTDGKTYMPRSQPSRPKRPDTTKAVAVALHKLDEAARAFAAVDATKLADYASEVPVWTGNLAQSMKAIHAFDEQLKRIST